MRWEVVVCPPVGVSDPVLVQALERDGLRQQAHMLQKARRFLTKEKVRYTPYNIEGMEQTAADNDEI